MDNFLFQAMIYFAAAIIFVPIAKKLGMGSVLGYLIAGMVIGPFLLGFIGNEGEDIMHFAEFGVVMMLFLIGLELEPRKLWAIRQRVVGLGFTQLFGTAIILFGLALLFGVIWQAALAVALTLSMSSTAIVLQTYKEKNQMETPAGRNSFAVLLFQDMSLVPMLALFPLLAFTPVAEGYFNTSIINDLPAWLQTVTLLAAISLVVLIGRFAIVPLLRVVANTNLQELFVVSALLIVVSIAFLMEFVGLSPALGTFLAGVILANSEFKHELESNLEPFKGLLLGLFFMAVGASIKFNMIVNNTNLIVSLTLGIIMVKILILLLVGRLFKMPKHQKRTFAIGLSQVGEFSFVLFAFIGQIGILSTEHTEIMMAVTATSMTITPLIILFNEKVLLRYLTVADNRETESDQIDEKNQVIIAGFSHFGSTIGRFLKANGVEATYLDYDSNRVESLRKVGFKVYYGDATRVDFLAAAGAAEAKILIIAIDSPETNIELVKKVKKHFPDLQLMVRAKNRIDAYELLELKASSVYREHLDTSIRLGVDVLIKLGSRAYTATRSGQNFRQYDELAMQYLAEHRHHHDTYISKTRQQIEIQEELLSNDLKYQPNQNDHFWDSEYIRESQDK